ncbi:MAG: penicillin-binding transpeptidase domain-containing protein [Tissierellia bacterium]|nr:penicillin-binding transpeptidase domain-containing protein [Tissierellia bacterium]
MKKTFLNTLNKINRPQFFKGLMGLLFVLLLFQLFKLTLVQGRHYRQLSDSRRIKEVQITAQRGEVRDRNGVLLAGNRPAFTLQLRKDELDRLDPEEKNTYFLQLIRYLEEDRVETLDEFPILLNSFVYPKLEDYFQEESPQDKVVARLSQRDYLNEFLEVEMVKPYGSHFTYNLKEEALDAARMDRENGPILLRGGTFSYINDQERDRFKRQENLDKTSSAKEDLVTILIQKPSFLQEILGHPIARKLAYDFLKAKGQAGGIALREVGNAYYDDFIKKKVQLMSVYKGVSFESSAQEDFFLLFRANSLENLLRKPLEDAKEDYPALILADLANHKLRAPVFKTKLVSKEPRVFLESGEDGFDQLIKLALEDDQVLKDFLDKEGMKGAAQDQLIEDGISSGISVAGEGYSYTSLTNAKDLFERFDVDRKEGNGALFKAMVEKAGLDPRLSPYEQRDILNAYNEVSKQGSYAYIPVNFAYEISQRAVAQIEENIPMNIGIDISVEPIRHYPLGTSTAHILGYIGSIAQESEIKKYVEEEGYNRNDLIGKTGIEEAYEKTLRGKNGKRVVAVDSIGNTTEILEEQAPTEGNNVNLSIDVNLQLKAEEALENCLEGIRTGGTYQSPWGTYNYTTSTEKGRPYKNATSGAVVALDVKTGEVLALANFPSYDPNLFATGISASDWDSLQPEEEKDLLAPRPLYNIAYQSAIQPGSSFKMVTAMAALENGLDPLETIKCGGYVEFGKKRFGCWIWNQHGKTHGDETLADAIRDSCNYYFYSLALGKDQRKDIPISAKVSAEDISQMAQRFGLGESVGLEIKVPNETLGRRPDPADKTRTLKALLGRHLDENLNFYMGKKLKDKEKEDLKEKILATLDRDETMTREEVYKFLEDLGVDTEKKVQGSREGLVDILKYTYIDEAKWKLSDTMNITIGQGENAYTPIQMARYTMALANGGDLYQLSLVDSVSSPQTGQVLEKERPLKEEVGLSDPAYYDQVKKGMKMASLDGLNKSLFEDFPIEVGLKTGTAERSGTNPYTHDTYDSFAWEVAFAPYDKPEIAVVAMVFQGGSGGNVSPIIHSLMSEYFGLNKEVVEDTLPIETRLEP